MANHVIRPADVCKTLVTVRFTVSPIRFRPPLHNDHRPIVEITNPLPANFPRGVSHLDQFVFSNSSEILRIVALAARGKSLLTRMI